MFCVRIARTWRIQEARLMAKLTYFPLLIDRWVAGTQELTFEERGFYISLIVWLYDTGKPIKDSDHAARILRCDKRTSRRLLGKLRPKFRLTSAGLRHRLCDELLRNGGKIKGIDGNRFPLKPDPDLKNPPIGPPIKPEKPKPKPKRQQKQAAFKKPDISEVRAYCEERGNGIDPEGFMAHYEANGWKVGRNSMKNWKAAVVTWEKKRKQDKPIRGNGKSISSWQQTIDSIGAQLGLSPRPGETYEQYGNRVNAAKTRAH